MAIVEKRRIIEARAEEVHRDQGITMHDSPLDEATKSLLAKADQHVNSMKTYVKQARTAAS